MSNVAVNDFHPVLMHKLILVRMRRSLCIIYCGPYKQATLYNTARLMGPKVSIACVWTCVSRPPSIIQPLLVCLMAAIMDQYFTWPPPRTQGSIDEDFHLSDNPNSLTDLTSITRSDSGHTPLSGGQEVNFVGRARGHSLGKFSSRYRYNVLTCQLILANIKLCEKSTFLNQFDYPSHTSTHPHAPHTQHVQSH